LVTTITFDTIEVFKICPTYTGWEYASCVWKRVVDILSIAILLETFWSLHAAVGSRNACRFEELQEDDNDENV
jgi:hypothetical protein